MVRLLKFIVIAPLAILFLIFAFANRHFVTVSFDPFSSGDVPAFAIPAPLFAVIIAARAIGVVLGGVVTWIGQGKHRRAARALRVEAQKLKTDLQAANKAVAPAPLALTKRA